MRNIKTVGLLALAAMAVVAFVGTSVASATTPATFTSEKGNELTTMAVEGGNHVFTVEGSAVECEENSFTGESTAASQESQTIKPVYKKCKAFGFASATVNTGTCDYTFTAATEGEHAAVHITNCADTTKGIQIEVNVPFIAKCVVDVPQQTVKKAVHYTNTTYETEDKKLDMDVRVDVTASGIMNDVTTSTGACPLKVGTNETGIYTGKSTLTGSNGNITWSPAVP